MKPAVFFHAVKRTFSFLLCNYTMRIVKTELTKLRSTSIAGATY